MAAFIKEHFPAHIVPLVCQCYLVNPHTLTLSHTYTSRNGGNLFNIHWDFVKLDFTNPYASTSGCKSLMAFIQL